VSRPTEPLRSPSRIEHDAHGGVLIGRVLKRAGIPNEAISAIVDIDTPDVFPLQAAFIDATKGRPTLTRSSATAFHALWCSDEPSAYVCMRMNDAGHLVRRRIAPGDTIYVPPFHPLAIGPGILGYEVSSLATATRPAADLPQPLPTHGLERFEGYNRRTVCAAGPNLVLERWKVTQPLILSRLAGRSRFVTNLVEPMAIVWRGGSDLIGRAESRLLPAGMTSCTFIPDGLGYLLVSYVPDLFADVVTPLRNAGHSDAVIAMLGDVTQAVPAFEADDRRRSAPPRTASARSMPDAPETSGTGT